MAWTNKDGLTVLMHGEQGEINTTGATGESTALQLVVEIPDATEVPSSAATPSALDAYIPAGAYITRAYTIVKDAFTSGGAATLTIGLYEQDGTAIDADGIDAAVALSALNAEGKVVVNDGALVEGTATVGSENAYVEVNYGTAAYTGGAATVVVEYFLV